jgi:hypothetical protein
MIKILTSYIKQRYNLKLQLPLIVFLMLYGINQTTDFTSGRRTLFLLIPLLLISFLAFRIFDDLVSRKDDGDKPERIHTKEQAVLPLSLLCFTLFLMSIIFTKFLLEEFFIYFLATILIGLLPYLIRLCSTRINFVLPLVKYGAFTLFICSVFNPITSIEIMNSIALIFAFTQYEILEDEKLNKFRKNIQWLFWSMVLIFIIPVPEYYVYMLVISILTYLTWIIKPMKYMHFYVLLLALILKNMLYV